MIWYMALFIHLFSFITSTEAGVSLEVSKNSTSEASEAATESFDTVKNDTSEMSNSANDNAMQDSVVAADHIVHLEDNFLGEVTNVANKVESLLIQAFGASVKVQTLAAYADLAQMVLSHLLATESSRTQSLARAKTVAGAILEAVSEGDAPSSPASSLPTQGPRIMKEKNISLNISGLGQAEDPPEPHFLLQDVDENSCRKCAASKARKSAEIASKTVKRTASKVSSVSKSAVKSVKSSSTAKTTSDRITPQGTVVNKKTSIKLNLNLNKGSSKEETGNHNSHSVVHSHHYHTATHHHSAGCTVCQHNAMSGHYYHR